MRHFIYLILLFGFAVSQAQDEVFNPAEQKAEDCQKYEEIKDVLSCEGEDCPPLYTSAVSLPFQVTASMVCAFECVVGERMCDETLNPDNEAGFYTEGHYSCGVSSDGDTDADTPTERTEKWQDDEGVKHVEKITIYSSGCEESVQHIEVCNQEGQECQLIELYSEAWYAYERQKQTEAYEASCSIATEADCKNIEAEMGQCMLDLTEGMSEFFCASSKAALWRYRKYGARVGSFGMGVKPKRINFHKKEYPSSVDNIVMEKPMKKED